MPTVGDPSLNPWLPVERVAVASGYDAEGKPVSETLRGDERPSYYFWLGKDAYLEPREIRGVLAASTQAFASVRVWFAHR